MALCYNTDMKQALCEDCGDIAVYHPAERWAARLDWLFNPVLKPFELCSRMVLPLFDLARVDKMTALLLRTLALHGFATVQSAPDDRDPLRTRCLFEAAAARGVSLSIFRIMGQRRLSFMVAEYGGKVVAFEGLPRPSFVPSKSLSWMDNKGTMKKKFPRAGIPVPKGGVARSERRALKIFRRIGKPAIAKPSVGSGSRHTTIHIETEDELLAAFHKARELSPWVVIEEELAGPVFRATVIDGKLVGVVRRDPAQVTGDGRRTIAELVREENLHPLRQGPIFSKVAIDKETEKELNRQKMTLASVPPRGAIVTLQQKINWHLGGTTTEVTDDVHPENARLFEKVAAFLRDPIVGIDFIIGDISGPWQDQKRCGVIECNSLPFIDNHHYLFAGKPRDAAGAVWEMIFPELRPSNKKPA